MKVVPIELVTHKAKSSTTLCLLRKIGPLPDNSYRYQCSLDRDVDYDDGDGLQTYKARIGYDPSALVSTSDLGVDNAEGQMLAPLVTHELEGITVAQVEAGALDKVEFVVYEVNYNDLTPGRHEIRNGGTFGEVTRKFNDTVLIPEERSLSQQLKQNVGEVYSLTCRATFGSQPIGTGGGVKEERFPCGFDTSGLYVDVIATAVDTDEPDLVFSDESLTQDDDYFQYGVVTCTAGANAGQTREIESFAGGQFVLRFPFTHPMAIADAFSARPGCSKRRDGNNGCKTWWGTEWGLHYRGEPYMPIADAAKIMVPGAGLTGNYSGTGEVVTTSTPVGGGTPTVPGDTPSTGRTRGTTTVTVASSYGDGVTDATAAINAAIASLPGDGGTVIVPAGTYLIDPEVSVVPVSNMHLQLADGCTLKAKYTANDHKYVVLIEDVSNVEVSGGAIVGYRDLWSPITGTTSEWGHCIACYGSSAVTVRDISLSKAVGDGMSVGGHSGVGCTDIVVDNVSSTDNRRQGLSLVWVDGCTVTDSTFARTSGTSPECGIDIEPEGGEAVQNVTIRNCTLASNSKYGLNILKRSGITATVDTITVTGCTVGGSVSAGNLSNGIVITSASNVTVEDNTISYNSATGLRSTSVTNLTVTGNTFRHNYTRNGIDSSDTDHVIASGLNSPSTDPHVLIPTAGSGQSITNNTFGY